MARFLNVVLFNPTAGGTTDFTVSAAVQGYLTPNAAGAANGAVYRYRAENATLTEWEVGYGTYNTGTGVLTRTVVLYNSLGTTAKINFTAAPNVGMGMPLASDIFPFVSDTPPTDPEDGALWWESDTGVLYIYYNDGSSKQWVGIQSQSNIAAVLFTAQSLTAAQQQQAKSNINVGDAEVGSGIFAYVSATQCKFSPQNGSRIKINGVFYDIPAAGITISNASLSASTVYFAYVWMNAGVMTLEFSTTGRGLDISGTANTGTVIKSGDATRTLVGMIRTTAGSQFADQQDARWVRSWFNESGVTGFVMQTSALPLTNTAVAEIDASLRLNLLLWAGESVHVTGTAACANNTLGNLNYGGVGLNGSGVVSNYAYFNQAVAGYVFSIPLSWSQQIAADGHNFFTLVGLTGANTLTWYYRQLSCSTVRRNF